MDHNSTLYNVFLSRAVIMKYHRDLNKFSFSESIRLEDQYPDVNQIDY